MRRTTSLALAFSVLVWMQACGGTPREAARNAVDAEPAVPAVDGAAVLEHTKVLASDEFEGRLPGTGGEESTVNYLVAQLQKIGVKPGNPDGTYIQKVPLVGITVSGKPNLNFAGRGVRQTLQWRDDFVAWTKRVVDKVELAGSEMVFVGYGVEAPEYGWDDFKGVDLTGKTMVVLVGDPPVPDPAAPAQLDPKTFGGRAMTYYGRWTYKYEMGAKKGASAVLIVHETEAAGYPFAVVQGKTAEQFDLVAPDGNMNRAAVEGWISQAKAEKLFAAAGRSFGDMKKSAVTREFKAVPLGLSASVSLENRIRRIDSRNVAGVLEGSDPTLKGEYVIYTSHWDHFGIGEPINGDSVYHGAIDNASGVAGTLEIARALSTARPAPGRSVLFLFVTAEEQGLLGSSHYAASPLYPLTRTVAVINIDGLNVHGRTKDLVIVGLGQSELDDYVERLAKKQDRVVRPDPEPEKGSYFRSDHFPFAKQGVPALNAGTGIDFIGKPADFGSKIRAEYTANDYHKPTDNVRPDWDLSGAVEDLGLYLGVGYEVSRASTWPSWKPGSEFKARRDEMLKPTAR